MKIKPLLLLLAYIKYYPLVMLENNVLYKLSALAEKIPLGLEKFLSDAELTHKLQVCKCDRILL